MIPNQSLSDYEIRNHNFWVLKVYVVWVADPFLLSILTDDRDLSIDRGKDWPLIKSILVHGEIPPQ